MKFGLTGRLIASHGLVAFVAITVFSGVVLFSVGQQARRVGLTVDYADAYRMIPDIRESLNETRSAPLRAFPDEQPMRRDFDQRDRPMGPMMGVRRPAPFPVPLSRLIDRPIIVVDRSGRIVLREGDAPRALPDSLHPTDGVSLALPGEEPDLFLFVGGMIDPTNNPLSEALVTGTARAAVLSGLVVVVAAIMASFFWARIFLRPLREIHTAAGAIAHGNYDRRVPIPSGHHELAELSQRFNEMAGEVEAQEQSRRRFVGDAAHELRTPLSLLAARIEMLQQGIYAPDESQYDALTIDIGRMSRLVDDLQTLARADAGRLALRVQDIPISDAVNDACEPLRPVSDKKGITIEIRHRTPGAKISVDIDRFRQIVMNLLSNAIRYTPHGQTITVETDADHDWVTIGIEDPGPGIPESERTRVFERFVRLDPGRERDHGGSGLGLAIVAELVHHQRGTIEMTGPRDGGHGTRCIVGFPANTYSSNTRFPAESTRR